MYSEELLVVGVYGFGLVIHEFCFDFLPTSLDWKRMVRSVDVNVIDRGRFDRKGSEVMIWFYYSINLSISLYRVWIYSTAEWICLMNNACYWRKIELINLLSCRSSGLSTRNVAFSSLVDILRGTYRCRWIMMVISSQTHLFLPYFVCVVYHFVSPRAL